MTKHEIIEAFIKKGILSGKSGLIRRPYCWRSRYDAEAQDIFAEFAKGYRSDDEAWFCLCRDIELPICPVCKKEKVKFTGITKNGGVGYNTTCENCSANAVQTKRQRVRDSLLSRTDEERASAERKRKATNIARYGEATYMSFGSASFKNMMVGRYGKPGFSNVEKRRRTCLERYGVTSNLFIPGVRERALLASWSDDCRKRRIDHCKSETGFVAYCCTPEVQAKSIASKRARINEIESEHDCTLMATVSRKYGQSYKRFGLEYLRFGMWVFVQNKDLPLIQAYHAEGTHTNQYTSKPEKEVLEYVRSIYGGEVKENCTSIVRNGNHRFFELDIYIPKLRLAIDFDGTYYHSTKFKDKLYHARKTAFCRKAGVNMIHVFEDNWKCDRASCERIIKACIDGNFQNVLEIDGETIIGDNALPVLGDYEVISFSSPQAHQSGKNTYYDCGRIFYKPRGVKHEERGRDRQSQVQAV